MRNGIALATINPLRFFCRYIFLTASVTAVNAQDAKPKCPPPARVDDVKETIHGAVVKRSVSLARGSKQPRDARVDRRGKRLHPVGPRVLFRAKTPSPSNWAN